MGFYGNIANTSKTTFSFDLIYDSRWQMDQNAETDGVFLGRYVLIQYDAVPIKAYFNKNDNWMYNSPIFTSATKITTAREGQLYQDIANANSVYGFYIYKDGKFEGIRSASESPYALNFQTDVKEYGRGYDATVWMKQFNPESGDYRYVMMAELNAVVPTFHLVLDAPTEAPIAPYFDRDSTNIDYYLHVQPQYGVRVAKKVDNVPSDENVTRKFITWDKAPDSGRYDWSENIEEDVAADIYFNRAGFSYAERTHEDEVKNTINYNYVKSGRVYGKDPETSVWDPNLEKEDTYEWYFRLPAIGNSICEMWDKVYGLPYNNEEAGITNGNKRNLNYSQVANDSASHLVTYDRTTLMGILNTARDLFGYTFLPFSAAPVSGDSLLKDKETVVTITPPASNGVAWSTVSYKALDCLYYDVDDNGSVTKYYYYAYTPELKEFTGTTPSASTVYYYEDGRIANIGMWKAETADGGTPANAANKIFYRSDAWKLKELERTGNDTYYSILNEIHGLIGTGSEEIRNFNSIRGSINIMKDLLGSINLNLKPGRLVHTNVDTGVIESTNTYFPGSAEDQTKVLDGSGHWVNRVKTITVGVGDSGETAVTDIEPSTNIPIEADNDNTNDITLDSGNRWIRLASDGERHITLAHYTQTPEDNPEYYNFNDNTNGAPTTETFDTQTVAWDEAGHIKSYVTTTYDLPKGYKHIRVTGETQDETPQKADLVVTADYTTDTIAFKPGNRWINLSAQDGNREAQTENNIVYSHILSGVTEGKYGLAASETIDILDGDNTFEVPYYTVDKAGHITASVTNTVTIPENFEKVVLEISDDKEETEMEAKAGDFSPTTLVDTITFGTKNKWIRAAITDKRIDFAHRLSPIASTISDQNLETSNTFDVFSYEFDPAGHVIKKDTKTITMPFAFKKFTVGAKVDSVKNDVSHVTGSAEPDAHADEFTFYNGNKWIDIAMNRAGANTNVGDSMTFSHSVLHTTPIEKGITADETPKFGSQFTVPSLAIDEAGHVTAVADHKVTIPLPSMSVSEGNVVVNTSLTDVDGAISVSRVNVGTLDLAEYTPSTVTAPDDVDYTDTINSAFAKLQKQMNEEEAARAKAIEDEAKARKTADDAEIAAREKAIADEVAARDNAISTAINTEVTNRNAAIKDAIDAEVEARDQAIEDAMDNLVNGASAGYDTLKELEDLLNQETTDAAVLVNLRTDLITQTNTLTNHIENKQNPHEVTAEQLGLGEFKDESKNTLFASAEFAAAVEAILKNFTLSLAAPLYNLEHEEGSAIAKITLETQDGEVEVIWEKKQLDSNEFAVAESVPAEALEYEAKTTEEAGVYRCALTRTYMGQKSSTIYTPEFELVYEEPVVTPPEEEEEDIPTE